MDNIIKCDECGCVLIQEESENHQCTTGQIHDYWFDTDDDFIMICDGKNWIPHRNINRGVTRRKSTDKEPEP